MSLRNGIAPHAHIGKGISPQRFDVGGPVAGSLAGNPVQGMIQQMSALPTEKLQEIVSRAGQSQQGQMAQRMLQQRQMMPNAPSMNPTQQSPQAAQSAQAQAQAQINPAGGQAQQQASPTMRRGGTVPRLAMGGMSMSMQDPSWTRMAQSAIARDHPTGLINSPVPGRTDRIPMTPPSGSYVIPADVVSGLGEGNTAAGAKALDLAMSTQPHGIAAPQMHRGIGMPRPPPAAPVGDSAGGRNKGVDVIVAGGEYIVPPHVVHHLGGGDMKKGHDYLDRMVVKLRQRIVREMSKLPGPKK